MEQKCLSDKLLRSFIPFIKFPEFVDLGDFPLQLTVGPTEHFPIDRSPLGDAVKGSVSGDTIGPKPSDA